MNGSTFNGSTGRGMGWIPDLPSVKDYTPATEVIAAQLGRVQGTAAAAAAGAALPASVDLRKYMPPVEDQGELGSCTAHAAVALVEYMERRATGRHVDASRLFVYYTTRYLLGWVEDGDTGGYLRTAMGALAMFGAPPERYWPYTPARFNRKPDAECYALGQSFRAVKYFRLDENRVSGAALLDRIRKHLASGFPVMFGVTIYDEFMTPAAIEGPLLYGVPYPRAGSREHGGHAIVACGYDDAQEALLIRNSWGEQWGDGGYALMDYRYVIEGVADDFWCVTKQEWVETGNFGA
jgi:C1A family cysteine protease